MVTEADRAYAAGYFEGRGYFRITMGGGRSNGPRIRVVVNVHYKQAEWFVERWGGTLQRYTAGNTGGASGISKHSDKWCGWALSFDDAKRFLIDIHPYLKRKHKAAKLCAVYLHTLSTMPVKLGVVDLLRLQRIATWADRAREESVN